MRLILPFNLCCEWVAFSITKLFLWIAFPCVRNSLFDLGMYVCHVSLLHQSSSISSALLGGGCAHTRATDSTWELEKSSSDMGELENNHCCSPSLWFSRSSLALLFTEEQPCQLTLNKLHISPSKRRKGKYIKFFQAILHVIIRYYPQPWDCLGGSDPIRNQGFTILDPQVVTH